MNALHFGKKRTVQGDYRTQFCNVICKKDTLFKMIFDSER